MSLAIIKKAQTRELLQAGGMEPDVYGTRKRLAQRGLVYRRAEAGA
jgi:hypothetical protein